MRAESVTDHRGHIGVRLVAALVGFVQPPGGVAELVGGFSRVEAGRDTSVPKK
jgi:hypothetical protein